MRIVGIDPGFSGAIALLDPDTYHIEVHDMPLQTDASSGKEDLDDAALAELLIPSGQGRNLAFLERVAAMKGQGVTSMFRFGHAYGAARMAIRAHGYECHYPTPGKWKGHFRIPPRKDMTDSQYKRLSLTLAKDRFPALASRLQRVKDHGRAEAALIALYGLEILRLPA